MVSVCIAEPCGNDFVKMPILEAMRQVIQLPVALFRGAARISDGIGAFVRAVHTAVAIAGRPYVFIVGRGLTMLREGRNAWNRAVAIADDLVNKTVIISVSLAVAVLAVAYLYWCSTSQEQRATISS
jgi:hypothetical protein